MKNSTLFSVETRFKDRFYCCLESLKGNYKFLLVFLMFMGSFMQKASAQGTLVPSCNLIGPLEACAVADPNDTSGDFIINIEVARSGAPNLTDAQHNANFVYSFPSNSSGAFIRSYGNVVYNPVTNRTTQSLVVFPGSGTPEFNLQLNATNTTSSPATVCECSKSVSVSRVAATSSHSPILCYGQTSTLTVVGQYSDIGQYTYTLLPSGPTNTTGIFPNLPGSEAGITYVVNVESAEGCITTTSQTITQPAFNPVVLTCPQPGTISACQSPEAINASFTAWLNSFSYTGGTSASLTRSPLQPALPSLCGGSTTVTWTVTDRCGQPQTCTATFTITPAPAVSVTQPENSTTASCSYASQDEATAAFNAWLAQFNVTGGCAPVGSYGQPQAPAYCGGSVSVTYTVTDRCYATSTVTRTFTITAPAPVVVTSAQNSTTSTCSYADQAAADAAFTTWLQGFSVSGGCSPVGSFGEGQQTAPSFCGGQRTVIYRITDRCYQTQTRTATFTITPAPAVVSNVPENSSSNACSYADQAAADAAYQAWLNSFTVSGGCAPVGGFTSEQTAPAYCGGSRTVTYVISDKCSQPVSYTRTFTITPAPAVVIASSENASSSTCSYADQAAADAAFAAWLRGFTVSGGCAPVGSFGEGTPAAPAYCGGATTVTYSVTDKCAEPQTRTATFTITPAPAVVIASPENATSTTCSYADQAAADAAFAAWLRGFTVSGGCAPSASYGEPAAPAYCGGATTVTYTVSDKCYETQTRTATFTITPAPAVVIASSESATSTTCSYADQAAADAAFAAWLRGFTVSGGCAPVGSFGEGTPAAPAYCGGATTVTYTVSDKCYETQTRTATFTITPAPAVVIASSENASSSTCSYADQAAADAAFAAWLRGFTVSGGCAPVGSFGEGTPAAPAYCGGATTVTYTVSDKCYDSQTRTATFTITPAPAVVIASSENASSSTCSYADQAAADAAFAAWLRGFTVSGGCAPVGSFGEGTPSAPAYCGGATTVTYTVSDKCYDSQTRTATFTITPAPAVVIASPESATSATCSYADQAAADAAFAAWLQGFSVTGGCAPTASYGEPAAPAYCGGATTVTYTVSDKCYETQTRTATFTITPAAEVVVSGSQNMTSGACSYADQAAADAAFAAWLRGFAVSGGCAPVGSFGEGTPAAPAHCGGATTVTYTVTDKCYQGTSITATFTITPAPAVVVGQPANSTTPASSYADQAAADAAFAAWLAQFTVSGGCAPTGSYGEPTAPYYCGGEKTVTYTVTDKCYETTTHTATFTITPATPATITTPENSTSSACSYADQAAANAAFAAWLAQFTATGGISPVVSFGEGTPAAPQYCGGTVTVTYTVTDRCFEPVVNVRTFTITAPAPVVTNAPENSTSATCSYADQAAADAAFATWLEGFNVTGGCAPVGVLGTVGAQGGTAPVAPAYCGGTVSVSYSVIDKCYQGAFIVRSFTITPAAAVVVNTPENSTSAACSYADQAAADAAFAAWLRGFTVTGGCAPVGSFGEGTPAAPSACGGSRTVTYTVTDKCYESTRHSATFTITPAPAVVISSPENSTSAACSYADQAAADAAYQAWLNSFTVSGGCAPVGGFASEQTAPAYCGGTRTVTYTVTDKCSQPQTRTATFTITPAAAVVAHAASNSTTAACSYANQAAANAAFATWLQGFSVTGGCAPVGSFGEGTPAAPAYCGGATTVTYTVSDKCYQGTPVTATFTITAAPAVVFNCGNNVTVPACSTQAQVNAAWAAFKASASATGGCNAGTLTNNAPANAPSICGGSVDVTWTYNVSGCGQSQSCTRTFTVATPAPVVLTCAENVTLPACSTQAQLNAAWTAFLNSTTATGGCNGQLTRTSCSAPSLCGGYVDVTWTYTVSSCGQQSGCGNNSNSVHCTKRFTVAAPAAVVITPGSNVTLPACSTQAQLTAAWTAFLNSTTATGGCNGQLTRTSCSAPSLCGGYVDVTWTYTVASCGQQSGCGNSNSQSVTRRFTVAAPSQVVFNCGNNVTVPACSTQAQITSAWNTFLASTTASGGCGGQLTRTQATAPSACGGYVDVTWTYTVASCGQQSGCGNSNSLTCTKRFTVAATTPVVFNCGNDVTVPACSTQAQVNSAWTAFLASTTASGGCNGTFSRTSATTPSSCGGSVDVTWTYRTTACGGESSVQTCTKTFTVAAPAQVVMTPGSNVTLPACSTQAQLNTAWTAFLNSTTATGGCNGQLTRTSCSAPALCGGYVDVTWTYTVATCGQQSGCGNNNTSSQSQSITRRFTVATPSPLTFSAGNNVTVPACSTQAQLNAAWTTFLNSTTVTGGCNATLTRTSCSAPALCGGYVDVTWTATTASCGQQSGCGSNSNSQSITRRFTVSAPSAVTFNCGNNVTVAANSSQAQITAAWNTFLESTTANGGCNGTLTRTSAAMPTTCGQYADVTWTYTVGSCGQQSGCGSSNSMTCTKRFTVGAGSTAVTVNAGSNVTVPSCKTQAQVNALWASFVASTTVSGGNGTLTNNASSCSIPSACGGYADVTWTYVGSGCGQTVVTCGGQTTTVNNTYTVTRRFTVTAGGGVNVSGPSNATYTSSSFNSQYAVNNAFACWLAQFTTVSSGCGSTAVFSGDCRVAPSWTSGGSVRVVYSITGNCNSDSVCATFTITRGGSSCKVETTETAKAPMAVKAYPNPFSENFNLDLTTSSVDKVGVAIYDMTGKLIEQREINADEVSSLQVGDRYSSGVYNVIVTQGNEVKTLRVIKR